MYGPGWCWEDGQGGLDSTRRVCHAMWAVSMRIPATATGVVAITWMSHRGFV